MKSVWSLIQDNHVVICRDVEKHIKLLLYMWLKVRKTRILFCPIHVEVRLMRNS